MSTSTMLSSPTASLSDNLEELIQEVAPDDVDAELSNNTSAQSSPCSETQHLSPCAVDSLKKVNSLKKNFQAEFEKIEKSIQNEIQAENMSESTATQQTPVSAANTSVEDRCTPQAVMQDFVEESIPVTQVFVQEAAKPVKVQKELFRERIKPQRPVDVTSRLLQATRSMSAKRVMGASKEERKDQQQQQQQQQQACGSKPRCASAGVRRRPPTQAEAPTFMSRPSRPSEVKLTSEEMEFQRVEKERSDAEREMKKHQKSFLVLKTKGVIPTTVRSVKELTIPMTPCFPTDQGKRKRVFADEQAAEDKDKGAAAAAAAAADAGKPRGPTVPAPFQFATTRRHGDVERSVDSEPTSGECIESFTKNTRSTYVPSKVASGPTHPQAPTFRTEMRSNSVGRPKPLSRDELEEKEMLEAQALAFKAKPVNKKIFDSMGVSGVPKVPVKEATTFAEFRLSCDDRAAYHATHKAAEIQDQQGPTSFRALEMPDFSKAPRARTPTSTPKLTEARSPKLSGGVRSSSAPARRQKPSHEEAERKRREEAEAWKLKIKEHSELTQPKEFHLKTTDRGKVSQTATQERIRRQMLEEKQATEVHATPFNEKIFKKSFSVSTSQKELTEFQEFKLQTDERHKEHMVKSMEMMQDSMKKPEPFHARPCPATTREPGFKPSPSEKEPVTPLNVQLSSEQRSLQRKSFDEAVSKHKLEEQMAKEKQKAAQEDKENFELNKLRRTPVSRGGMSFKASKVLEKDPFPAHQVAATPLTEPKSPNLRTALRNRPLHADEPARA